MTPAFYPTLFQHLATDYQRNLAVTAGAGTGKTEVLTRRIIKILAREKHLLDRLLVLTFTDKAAVEMKERIYSAIEKELAKTGVNHFQILKDTFLNNYISTIHSFCAALLREYPIEAGIDPYFRVLDETEKVFFLRKSINRSIREQAADKNNPDIRLLSEEFSRSAISNAVFTIIQKREDMIPWIEEYNGLEWEAYRKRLDSYRACIIREICFKLFVSDELQKLRQELEALEPVIPDDDYAVSRKRKKVMKLLPQFLQEIGWAAEEPSDPYSVNVDVERTKELHLEIISEARLTGKAPEAWPVEAYQKVRGIFRSLRYILEAFPIGDFEIGEEHERQGYEMLKSMARLTLYALKTYYEDKAAENYLDFQDLQLRAFSLLTDEKNRHILDELRERFLYIMVDEFQDTNEIQWRIIRKIAADNREKIVNPRLFVVGDEKQAIYSFRGGDVRLFSRVRRELLEANRHNLFHRHPFDLSLDGEKDYTVEYEEKLKNDNMARAGEIVFADNFRSAEEPVNFFNMFFHDLLSRKIYEEYDARPQTLICSGNKSTGSVELLLADKGNAGAEGDMVFNLPGEYDREPVGPATNGLETIGGGVSSDGGPEIKAALNAELKPHLKEALLIAGKIKEVFRGDDEKYRRVRECAAKGKPAVAILLNRRTMLKVYEEALRMNRINFTVVRGRGFFQRQEIVDLGNLLTFIVDPADDLYLIAFLRSSAGHVSDEGIFLLSRTVAGSTLWEKLLSFAKSRGDRKHDGVAPVAFGSDAPLDEEIFSIRDRRALLNATENLKRWITLSGRLPLIEFLRLVLAEGGFYVSLSRGSRGGQSISNMEKLLDSARDMSLQDNIDLADFAGWLNNRIDFIDEEGEADIDISLGGAVQIMTVHQSKGLEFPMVFVPDLGALFNLGERETIFAEQVPYRMNIGGDTITRREQPEIGLNASNPDNEWESEPILIKRIMKKRLRDKLIAERKRLLYVAVTRAMDHLVLVGNADFSSDRLLNRIQYMPLDLMTNWLDWLNKILNISFKTPGLRGVIHYGNQSGAPMAIPYRKFISEHAEEHETSEYRTEFPL